MKGDHSIFLGLRLGLWVAASLVTCGHPDSAPPPNSGETASSDAVKIQAMAYLREGQPRRAHLILEGISPLDSADDLLLVGEAALRSGRFGRALEAYHQVLKIRPDDLLAMGRLARIAYLEARFEDAEEQLNWILARAPDHSEARGLRCRIRLQRGNLEGAAADARRWVALYPEKAEPLSALGVVLSRQESWKQARSALEASVSLDPDQIPAWLELGRVYEALGEPALSREAIGKVKALSRSRREASARRSAASYYRLQALKALEAGQPRAALEQFQRALAEDPQDPALFREAGEAALSAGQPGEARRLLNRAVELGPGDSLNLRARGEVALAQHDPAGALQDLREAARLDSADPRIHRALSMAYQALNSPLEAEREDALALQLERASISTTFLEATP